MGVRLVVAEPLGRQVETGPDLAVAAVVAVDIFVNSESKSSAPYFAVVFTYCFDMMFVRMEYLTF